GDDVGGGLDERGDLGTEQVQLASADHRVAFADVGAARADRLQFPALQREAGLEALLQVVLVAGALVQRNGAAGALAALLRAASLILGRLRTHPCILAEAGSRRYQAHARDPSIRPGWTLRSAHVRTGQRRGCLSATVCLV